MLIYLQLPLQLPHVVLLDPFGILTGRYIRVIRQGRGALLVPLRGCPTSLVNVQLVHQIIGQLRHPVKVGAKEFFRPFADNGTSQIVRAVASQRLAGRWIGAVCSSRSVAV